MAKYDLHLEGLSIRELALLRDALNTQRMTVRAQYTSENVHDEDGMLELLLTDTLIQRFRAAVPPEAFSKLYTVTNVRVIDDGIHVPRTVTP